jgi:hypothetical protein
MTAEITPAAALERLRLIVQHEYGYRCEGLEFACGCCMAWRAYDDIAAIVSSYIADRDAEDYGEGDA